MTKEQWLRCRSIWRLANYSQPPPRKMLLFVCACIRIFWGSMRPAHQRGVEATEDYADNLTSDIAWKQFAKTRSRFSSRFYSHQDSAVEYLMRFNYNGAVRELCYITVRQRTLLGCRRRLLGDKRLCNLFRHMVPYPGDKVGGVHNFREFVTSPPNGARV